METVACYEGLGIVLLQNEHPLAYVSKGLSNKHVGLYVYEKECLAIVENGGRICYINLLSSGKTK